MTAPASAVLAAAARRLDAAGVADPAGDARRLLAHAMGLAPDRLTLALALAEPLDPDAASRFEAAIGQRAARRPVAQITGQRAFWGRTFRVTGDVLDPRPETETLVAAALELDFARVLDLGTGSGCILLTLLAERAGSTGLGTDVSAPALAVARANAVALGVDARAGFALSNWLAAVTGRFDLVVSNPPYIAAGEIAALEPEVRDWEPRGALTPGGDGLDAYRAIAAGAGAVLAPGGQLLLEVGPTQAGAVAALCQAAGLAPVAVHRDLDGRERVVRMRQK